MSGLFLVDDLKKRSKLFRKRTIYRSRIFLEYYLKRSQKNPVFIIATRRTGSTLMASYLRSIPNLSFETEILNPSVFYGLPLKGISKKAALRHLTHSINFCKHRICGAKLLKYQLEAHSIKLEDLKSVFPDVRFIIVYRKSLFNQFVSFKIAEATDQWQWSENYSLPESIDVDRSEMLEFCVSTKEFYRELFSRSWLKDRAVVVSYEDLADKPREVFKEKIFPFLGLPVCGISSSLKKQNTKGGKAMVRNMDEIGLLADAPETTQAYDNIFHDQSVPGKVEVISKYAARST